MEYEYNRIEPPMDNPKKDLANMIDVIENLPHHYKEYLAFREDICKYIPFKEYFYYRFGHGPKDVDDYSFKRNKSIL